MLSDEVKKLFSCSTQLNIEFQLLIKMLKKKSFYDVFILLIVDILTFMNMISFMFSWVEHEKKFYNLMDWLKSYQAANLSFSDTNNPVYRVNILRTLVRLDERINDSAHVAEKQDIPQTLWLLNDRAVVCF